MKLTRNQARALKQYRRLLRERNSIYTYFEGDDAHWIRRCAHYHELLKPYFPRLHPKHQREFVMLRLKEVRS